MAKRRTKKERVEAKHNFTVSWRPEAINQISEANVKRQIKNTSKTKTAKKASPNRSKITGNIDNLASIKKDIYKSLGLAILILSSELMLYLFLNSKI